MQVPDRLNIPPRILPPDLKSDPVRALRSLRRVAEVHPKPCPNSVKRPAFESTGSALSDPTTGSQPTEDLILGQGWIAKHDASLRPAQNEVFIRLPTPLRLTNCTANPDVLPVTAHAVRAFHLRARRSHNVRIFSATLHDIEKALKAKIYTDPRANCPEWLLPVIDAFDRKKASELPPNRPGIDTEIRLKPGLSPPSCPLYSMSREELLLLRKTLYDLLDAGFIRASSAEGGAPVIFVKKPGGGLRFCVDYRALVMNSHSCHCHCIGLCLAPYPASVVSR
ncbi:uncharacterized protein BROUX77_003373 [Berkeleyomyces rouxiae]|uniref:uncharacterized protein n=1 Tax=Berkeleyomyces rouxiae TaxID=2035830 RepID=UPI003B79E3A2